MLINAANIGTLFQGFNTWFNKGLQAAPSRYKDVAMVIPSTTLETTYGWLGQFPRGLATGSLKTWKATVTPSRISCSRVPLKLNVPTWKTINTAFMAR